MTAVLILRPEPGASATAARAAALGLEPVVCPLFAIEALAWQVPDPSGFDALLLTSANAAAQAGPGLDGLGHLPVLAVGEATAAAARAAGLSVARSGTSDLAGLLDQLDRPRRLLHLCGEDRIGSEGRHAIVGCPVYRATAIAEPALPPTAGLLALVHSPRAGRRLGQLVADRSTLGIAAISAAAADACGSGWAGVAVAPAPTDGALLALAARLCQSRDR